MDLSQACKLATTFWRLAFKTLNEEFMGKPNPDVWARENHSGRGNRERSSYVSTACRTSQGHMLWSNWRTSRQSAENEIQNYKQGTQMVSLAPCALGARLKPNFCSLCKQVCRLFYLKTTPAQPVVYSISKHLYVVTVVVYSVSERLCVVSHSLHGQLLLIQSQSISVLSVILCMANCCLFNLRASLCCQSFSVWPIIVYSYPYPEASQIMHSKKWFKVNYNYFTYPMSDTQLQTA